MYTTQNSSDIAILTIFGSNGKYNLTISANLVSLIALPCQHIEKIFTENSLSNSEHKPKSIAKIIDKHNQGLE